MSCAILRQIDSALDRFDTRALRAICTKNIAQFLNCPAQLSNVANCVRFPLGEIGDNSIGIHVYFEGGGNEPIHSHAQNLHTFALNAEFEDELFSFAPQSEGNLVKYDISKELHDHEYDLIFQEAGKFVKTHSELRQIGKGNVGYLSADKPHRVRARKDVITLYKFSGPYLHSCTYLPHGSPFSISRVTNERSEMIHRARGVLAKACG